MSPFHWLTDTTLNKKKTVNNNLKDSHDESGKLTEYHVLIRIAVNEVTEKRAKRR